MDNYYDGGSVSILADSFQNSAHHIHTYKVSMETKVYLFHGHTLSKQTRLYELVGFSSSVLCNQFFF